MNGLERIAQAFAKARQEGRSALMPYYTLGYPNPETSLNVIQAVARAGADLIELGVPFSDPLADGPTIQRSTQVALEQGATMEGCLEMVRTLRSRGVEQPFLLMGYFNPVLAYGVSRLAQDAARAGADGFILPDLPPEEAGEVEAACLEHGLALVYLLAPTSTAERVAQAASRTTGFLYLVSLTGVTGARQALPDELQAFVRRVKALAGTPLAVGFGISTPEQAGAVAQMADGVIVGSALVEAAGRSDRPAQAAASFVGSLRAALDHLHPVG